MGTILFTIGGFTLGLIIGVCFGAGVLDQWSRR